MDLLVYVAAACVAVGVIGALGIGWKAHHRHAVVMARLYRP